MLCGGTLTTLHHLREYELAYCSRCELGRLAPMPSESALDALYASRAYFAGDDAVGYADYAAVAPQLRRTFARKLALLLRSGPVADLLEIGCGPGYFLHEARRAGVPRVAGVDRNPWAVAETRRSGFECWHGSIEAVPAERRFDAIAMLDVLEHVREPVPFLLEVADRLAPGGRLLLMTPDLRSILARVSGARWVSLKAPEHVFYYSRRSLGLLLDRAGFTPIAMRASGQYVTVAFVADRLGRLAPRLGRGVGRLATSLGIADATVFIGNGSLDVVARQTAAGAVSGR
jgi:2-polyprenyl-3-methyl-5-hydroxy-6-metoxy-1,4-benzoquinol methylase